MAKTKGQLATDALEDIGFDLPIDADDLRRSVKNLERMIGGWVNEKVYASYNFTTNPAPTDDSGISQFDEEAIVSNLSVRMADVFDVVISRKMMNTAKNALNKLKITSPPEYTGNPYQPLGAGKTRCYEYFFDYRYQREDDVIEVVVNDTRKAEVNFESFSPSNQIQSITWDARSAAITVSNIVTTGNRTEANLTFAQDGKFCVLVRATKNDGTTQTASLQYEVKECDTDIDRDFV